jgi:hypothetical protein
MDETDRFRVRTQVMKIFYEKKRHADDKNDAPSTPLQGQGSTRSPVKQQVKRFRLLPRGLQDLQAQSSSRRSGRPIEKQPPLPHAILEPHLDQPIAELANSVNSSAVVANQDHPEKETGQEGWQSLEPFPPACSTSTTGVYWPSIEDTSTFKRRTAKGKDKNKTTSQIRDSALDLSAGQLNPMVAMPDGAPPRTRILIHHYCKSA